MTPFVSHPCSCRAVRLAYKQASVTLGADIHRASNCYLPRIEIKPAFIPPAPRLLSFVCEHGDSRWAMGPEPEALVDALGCCCSAVA